jgi:uncharacterized membrane protein YedE/YeeE
MKRILAAAAIGITFGIGIAISGMANPAKVLNFFDFAGTWDASLGLVMASALAVAAVGYRFLLKRPRPVFEAKFHLPGNRKLDLPLVAGSAVFGIGWGITGFCPGGAIPALGLGEPSAWIFVGAMLAGIAAARTVRFALQQRATQNT